MSVVINDSNIKEIKIVKNNSILKEKIYQQMTLLKLEDMETIPFRKSKRIKLKIIKLNN